MSFLGVDIGTSFIKAAVLQPETRQLQHVTRVPFPDPVRTGSPLHCEYDPQAVVAAVRALIEQIAAHAPDCEGLVMCAQMHGLVLMNGKREAVSNCITWRDERALEAHPSGAGSYFDSIRERTSSDLRRQLGNELEPARPICFLYWLKEQRKLAPGLTPVSLPDFVLSTLCGADAGVEATNASAYGAFNLETFDWHASLIDTLGLRNLCWPPVRKQGEIVGFLKLGSRTMPCYTPVGDAQAALAGALLGEDELSLNIATGAQVSRLTKTLDFGEYQTRPYFDGKFIHTFSHPAGGRALNVLVDLIAELAPDNKSGHDPWAYIVDATEQVHETDLQVDLNLFSDSGVDRGAIRNIRSDNLTVGHLFRASFRSMAKSYYECAIRLWPEKSWKGLVFSGGLACKLAPIREETHRRFGSPFRLTPESEDTLFGLLILAVVFSGKAKSVEQVSLGLRSPKT